MAITHLNVLVVGPKGVGKTAYINKLTTGKFIKKDNNKDDNKEDKKDMKDIDENENKIETINSNNNKP